MDPIIEPSEEKIEIKTPRNWSKFLLGNPVRKCERCHTRVPKFKALAILSSDVLSSVAYAPEQTAIALLAIGAAGLGYIMPITVLIVLLLFIITFSYRQTIPVYPNGGGSFIVASDNLGKIIGLWAAGALLIDYVLTVAVSTASALLTLESIDQFHFLAGWHVSLCIIVIAVIAFIHMRGVNEASSIFVWPTYFFVATLGLTVVIGEIQAMTGNLHPALLNPNHILPMGSEAFSLFIIFKAFAAGCAAITGVEAVADGVPVFKEPQVKNAVNTQLWMAIILGTLFIGMALLGIQTHASPSTDQTMVAQVIYAVWSSVPILGWLMSSTTVFMTTVILLLAVNTSFVDFPRVANLLAYNQKLPKQFSFIGSKNVFSWGIVMLSIAAGFLLVIMKGNVTALINLYAIGVFTAVTLSQLGMAVHWWRVGHGIKKEAHETNIPFYSQWYTKLMINGFGACATAVVTVIIAVTKFTEGAWIVIFLIPMFVLLSLKIEKHYKSVNKMKELNYIDPGRPHEMKVHGIVLIKDVSIDAYNSALWVESISLHHIDYVHINLSEDMSNPLEIQEKWKRNMSWTGREVEILDWQYTDLADAIRSLILKKHQQCPDCHFMLFGSQSVHDTILGQLLHPNTSALMVLKLRGLKVAFTTIYSHLHKEREPFKLHIHRKREQIEEKDFTNGTGIQELVDTI